MEMVALGFIDKRLANHNSNLATPIGKVYQTKQNTNVSSHTEMVPECLSLQEKNALGSYRPSSTGSGAVQHTVVESIH